eukprot:scaffold126360_cov36-Phaeocystis_antarctica.AAC.1
MACMPTRPRRPSSINMPLECTVGVDMRVERDRLAVDEDRRRVGGRKVVAKAVVQGIERRRLTRRRLGSSLVHHVGVARRAPVLAVCVAFGLRRRWVVVGPETNRHRARPAGSSRRDWRRDGGLTEVTEHRVALLQHADKVGRPPRCERGRAAIEVAPHARVAEWHEFNFGDSARILLGVETGQHPIERLLVVVAEHGSLGEWHELLWRWLVHEGPGPGWWAICRRWW